MLTWLLVFPALTILASGKWQEIFTKNIWIIVSGLLGFITNAVVYFYDYQKPDKHPSFLSAISHPVDTFHYFLAFLGAPLALENLTVATIVGALVFSLWIFLYWQLFRLVKTDFILLHRLIVWLIIGVYSAFQIDELHRHNQNLVGRLHATSLLWSTDMKNAVCNY